MTSSGFDLLIFASYGASNDDVEDEVNMMETTRSYGGTILARMELAGQKICDLTEVEEFKSRNKDRDDLRAD